jgi:prevent-host-death family protein
VKQLGAYEAKTHLSRILDEVEHGESFTISKHGRPVAVLMPLMAPASPATTGEVIARLRRNRKGRTLGDVTVRELIDDGRR